MDAGFIFQWVTFALARLVMAMTLGYSPKGIKAAVYEKGLKELHCQLFNFRAFSIVVLPYCGADRKVLKARKCTEMYRGCHHSSPCSMHAWYWQMPLFY